MPNFPELIQSGRLKSALSHQSIVQSRPRVYDTTGSLEANPGPIFSQLKCIHCRYSENRLQGGAEDTSVFTDSTRTFLLWTSSFILKLPNTEQL